MAIMLVKTLVIVFLIGTATFIHLLYRTTKSVFGRVTLEQILFHAGAKANTVDTAIVKKYRRAVLDTLGITVITTAATLALISLASSVWIYLLAISLLLLALSVWHVASRYRVLQWLLRPNSPFIEEHYVRCEAVPSPQRKNILILFLESMEFTAADKSICGRNLIPDLIAMEAPSAYDGTAFRGFHQTEGSKWTMAGYVNALMGIPLFNMGIHTHGQLGLSRRFLPEAASLPLELKRSGYEVVSMMGADSRFADMDKLFATHGDAHVMDRKFFEKNGWNFKKNMATSLGFRDAFLYERAMETIAKLSVGEKPWCLVMRTLDTHFPDGFIEEKKDIIFGDVRDAFIMAGKMCAHFMSELSLMKCFKDTAIVILGDHLWMENVPTPYSKILKSVRERDVFNMFINHGIPKDSFTSRRQFAPFDFAPTILEAAGFTLPNHAFGLGVSLFSTRKTLVERYGIDAVNAELKKKSPFYTSFHGSSEFDIVRRTADFE